MAAAGLLFWKDPAAHALALAMTVPFFANTFISRSPKNLFRLLASLPNLKSSSHTVLFSLAPAPTLAQDDLQALVSHLTALPNSLGCLAAPIRVRTRKSDDRLQTSWRDTTVCSLAAFDSAQVVPFWSEIPGKEPTQVGRWHAFRKREDVSLDYMQAGMHREGKNVDWESVWAQKAQGVALPEGLGGLRHQDISTILYMTDGAPEGLTQSLEHFSEADKLGLVTSSTPFVTGRPHTLFYNGDIRSSGAVGLAFKRPSPSLSDEAKAWSPEGKPTQQLWSNPCLSVRFPSSLEEITDHLRVTSTEGNLVHTLNDENPSRLILQALSRRKTGDSESDVDLRLKDDEFFMGVNLDKGYHEGTELYQLYNIMSGDPSRGTISLQSDAAPEVGSVVKIYRASPQASLPDPIEEGLNFLTTAQSGNVEMPEPFDEDGCVSYTGAFLATSENGFVVQRPGERAWKSTVKGGQIKLTWRDPKSR